MHAHDESPAAPRLLDQVRARIRVLHYSIRTEEQYVQWIRRYILFHNKRHPAELGETHLEAFLSKLAVDGKVAASTQNQAKSAILFLYREVLRTPLGCLGNVSVAKSPERLPVVLTRSETQQWLHQIRAPWSARCAARACRGSCARAWGGAFAIRTRTKIPECRTRMGMAVRLSGKPAIDRSANRRVAASSS